MWRKNLITVIAHFNRGKATPFPEKLKGIGGEGSVYYREDSDNTDGGVIVVSYDTFNSSLIFEAFKEHLAENELSAIAMQKVGDGRFFFSWTESHIF